MKFRPMSASKIKIGKRSAWFIIHASFLCQDTDFLGREALLQQRQDGVSRRFVMLVLDDHDTELDLWPWWGEPIYCNGQLAGTTTSSAYSYTLERHVCLGFVSPPPGPDGHPTPITPDFINRGDYEVDIAGQRYPAKAKLYPFSSLFTQQKRRKEDMELSNLHREWCRSTWALWPSSTRSSHQPHPVF